MRKSLRYTLRFLAIAAAIAVVSLAFLTDASKSGPAASATETPECLDPLTCANLACNGCCWEEGWHYNPGTYVQFRQIFPVECGCTEGSCNTKPC